MSDRSVSSESQALSDACSETSVEEVPSEYVKLVGIPYDVTADEFSAFFKGFEMHKGLNIFIMRDKRHRNNGKAIARISSIAEAEKATAALNMTYIRNRYIEVFHLSQPSIDRYDLPTENNGSSRICRIRPKVNRESGQKENVLLLMNPTCKKRLRFEAVEIHSNKLFVHSPYTLPQVVVDTADCE